MLLQVELSSDELPTDEEDGACVGFRVVSFPLVRKKNPCVRPPPFHLFFFHFPAVDPKLLRSVKDQIKKAVLDRVSGKRTRGDVLAVFLHPTVSIVHVCASARTSGWLHRR